MFDYDYLIMIIFVITPVINVILEPFCKVEPYLRRKFLEEQMRIYQSDFWLFLAKNRKSSLGERRFFFGF